MNNNNMLKRRLLQKIVRQGGYIELEICSNSFCFVMFKNEKLDIRVEFNEHGQIEYIPIEVAKHMQGFFNRKILIITDFQIYDRDLSPEDKAIAKEINLKDIYEYLNIKNYKFDNDNNPIWYSLDDYHNILNSNIDQFKVAVANMSKDELTQLFYVADKLYKIGVLNNINIVKYIEQITDKIGHFIIG